MHLESVRHVGNKVFCVWDLLYTGARKEPYSIISLSKKPSVNLKLQKGYVRTQCPGNSSGGEV